MDKLLYLLILEDIEKSNFIKAIDRLRKVHNENDFEYLYLRSYLEYMQKNFYASLDFLLNTYVQFQESFKTNEKCYELLGKVLLSLERIDLLTDLKNINNRSDLLNKLVLWNGYKYK